MTATVLYVPGDAGVEEVADPVLSQGIDAIVRVARSAICGSDLWSYRSMEPTEMGTPMGHEFVGTVEEVGRDVCSLQRGDVVIAPFMFHDATCDLCTEGQFTSCRGDWGIDTPEAGQGEAVRVPLADGTLIKVPRQLDTALLPPLLTLSDFFATGHHGATSAQVGPGDTVVVVGDAHCHHATDVVNTRGDLQSEAESDRPGHLRKPLLTLSDLACAYGANRVLHSITFELRQRECLAIVGESGSGKTTLSRAIAGLVGQREGAILYATSQSGRTCGRAPPLRVSRSSTHSRTHTPLSIRVARSEKVRVDLLQVFVGSAALRHVPPERQGTSVDVLVAPQAEYTKQLLKNTPSF